MTDRRIELYCFPQFWRTGIGADFLNEDLGCMVTCYYPTLTNSIPGLVVIKLFFHFFNFNSAEHEISTAHKC